MNNTLCRWVSAKISKPPTEYLLVHEKQIIEEHLHECVHCSEMQDIADAMNHWKELEPPAVSPFLERKIITDALDGRLPQKFREKLWGSNVAPLFAIATIAVAVLVTTFVYLSNTSPKADKPAPESDLQQSSPVSGLATPQTYNLVHFEKATPINLMREDKVWGSEQAIVNLQVLSPKLTRIELIKGKIVARVTKRANGDRFEVVGPSGTVVVVGTIFSVEINDAGLQQVRVLEGIVEVTDRRTGAVTSVSRNNEFTIGSTDTVAASDQALDSDRNLMMAHSTIADEPKAQAKNAKTVTATNIRKKRSEISAAALASQAIDEKRLVEAKHHIDNARQSAGQGQDVPNLYARLARAHRQQKNYAAAKGTYEQLIQEYGNSSAAQNARVSLAQLELNVLGNPQAALRYFDDYLNTVPSGYLSEAAWIGRARSQQKLGHQSELLQTSNTYLSTYAKGSFAAEMMLYRANIRRQSGNCNLAQTDYQTIIAQWPNSRISKQAQQGLSACSPHQ